MSNALLVAPWERPLRLQFSIRPRTLIILATVALTGLATAGLPTVWPSHPGSSAPLPTDGYTITSMSAANPAQGLTTTFGMAGATITSAGARFTVGLTGVGRGAHVQPVAAVHPRLSNGVIRYAYPGAVTETWRNGPRGLEQGFILSSRPAGDGALSVAMPAPASSQLVGGAVLLPGGLRYAGLRATDSRGRVLHSWLALTPGQLMIKVSDRGAQYPVRIDPLVQKAANLTARDGAIGDYFGSSVAVSGNTLVAGAPYHEVGNNIDQGALYVFTAHSGRWKQTAEHSAAGGVPVEYLGTAVAMSGNTIVTSAPSEGTASQGALYVFQNSSGHWKQVAVLTASDAQPGDHLGAYSVAIQGKTIIAGAPAHSVGSTLGKGAVYAFNEPAGGWTTRTQSAEVSSTHGAEDEWLGWSVGISGNTIVAGAPGGQRAALYVFTKRSGHWKQTAELHQRDDDNDIGKAVAISGHTIAASPGAGAYVFQPAKGKWKQTADLSYIGSCQVYCPGSTGAGSIAFDGGAILSAATDAKGGYDVVGIGEYRQVDGKWRQVGSVAAGEVQHQREEPLAGALAASGDVVVAGMSNGLDKGSVAVFKGRVTSEGPLIGTIGSGVPGNIEVPVTCELPRKKLTCRVTISAVRAGSKKVMGHAKPKNIPGTRIKTVTVHMTAAFEHGLSKPNGVKVTFKVREFYHRKLKASGKRTITFTAE
jgi:hypothetical protein